MLTPDELQQVANYLASTPRTHYHVHNGIDSPLIDKNANGLLGAGAGSVTTVSVATANGFGGTVTNPTSTPQITITAGDITPTSVTTTGQFISTEYDNGNVTGTATINWNNGGNQYVTMTGATTFTFSNQKSGGRYILHVAGAYTPTWPTTVRWNGAGSAPTPTALAGHKDIYGFLYSGKESLYDGQQVANYLTT
jgi:hypothetical protein